MVTVLSGGTGTPKLLEGIVTVYDAAGTTVIANTGDDVELGGLIVCPDIDTVLYERGGVLDRRTWWGREDDEATTHEAVLELTDGIDRTREPRYLSDNTQVSGRDIATWRRFSGVGEFMRIGDRDRAVHLLRTGLLDEGNSLTETTAALGRAFDIEITLLPVSDEPIATIVHTPEGPMHFQEYWVYRGGEPTVEDVEYRGVAAASPTDEVLAALSAPVVIGPSNPVTSIGPMRAVESVEDVLNETTVVVVSPFIGETAFSGPAVELMKGIGAEPSTAGLAEFYPFADAFVVHETDRTSIDRPTIRTDTAMTEAADSVRVARAVESALEEV